MLKSVICILYLIWNFAVFLLMAADKYKARSGRWRIPERTLILCAFLLGAAGEVLGGIVFHHKTRKKKFLLAWPIALIVNACVLLFLRFYCFP